MKSVFLALILFLTTYEVQAIKHYCVGDTLHCLALNGLKLRLNPKGKVLDVISYGAAVVVSAKRDSIWRPDMVDNFSGLWIQVKFRNQSGYVFDGFLSKLAAPEPGDSTIVQYLNRTAQKVGTSISTRSNCTDEPDGEGTFTATVTLFQGRNFTAKRIEYQGWEWGHETLVFDYVSFEEVVLLYRAILKNTPLADKIVFPAPNAEKRIQFDLTQDDIGGETITIEFIESPDTEVRITNSYGY